jgi:predicted metal-dependent hydrolase
MFKIFYRLRRVRRRIKRRPLNIKKYLEHKETARILVHERIEFYNLRYNFKVGKVSIRNQRSRWGSCSSKGNLNFNYKISLIPPHLADYIIVHELCHLGQLNHSSKFWDLVAQTIPDWQKVRMELKKLRI